MTYPVNEGGAGRKGGRQRKKRVYLSRPEEEIPTKRANGSPFNQIWHNNEPLILTFVAEVPKEKSHCSHCGTEFPRGILCIIPFDVVLSHRERWSYYNRETKEYCPSPVGKKTIKYYCIKETCIKARFPYFTSDLLEIPETMVLKHGHKALLREQLKVLL